MYTHIYSLYLFAYLATRFILFPIDWLIVAAAVFAVIFRYLYVIIVSQLLLCFKWCEVKHNDGS